MTLLPVILPLYFPSLRVERNRKGQKPVKILEARLIVSTVGLWRFI
jgi:hypothetical protein